MELRVLHIPNITIFEAYTAFQFDTDCTDLSDFVDLLHNLYNKKSCYIIPLDSDIDSDIDIDNDNDNDNNNIE